MKPFRLYFFILALILFYFAFFPLGILIFKTFLPQNSSYLFLTFSKKSNWVALSNTLFLCFTTTFLSTSIGLSLAWFLHKIPVPRKKLWKSLFAIPYILPPYIGAMAWIKISHLFPSLNIYSFGGATWVLGLFFYSFIFLPCYASLEKMDASLEEAARLSGANTFHLFKDITFPLLKPALFGGSVLVFMATASAFGVPALLLMPAQTFVLTTKIYTDIMGYSGGLIKASGLSLILMVLGLLGLWLSQFFLRNKKFTAITGKYSSFSESKPFSSWKWPVFIVLVMVWGILVFLPLATIFMTSFLKVYGEPFSFSNISFHKYYYVLFDLPLTGKAFLNSFLFSSVASILAVMVGTAIAYMVSRIKIPGSRVLDMISTLPYATPGTVIAIGFILAFTGSFGLNLYNTLWILIAAYTVKYLSFSIRNTVSSLEQIDLSLEESARMCGASWKYSFWTILFPLLKPTLVASFFLVFMPTFSELTMSVFLVGPKTETLGTLLFNLQSYDDPQSAAVLATLMVCVIVISNLSLKKITQGQYGV